MACISDVHVGIVCPMANEGDDAVRFVRASLSQCSTCRKVTFFAILDTVTTDNSVELLRAYARQESRLRVVWAPENHSVVDAYVRGYREALASGCDWILEIDAGFSHRPEARNRWVAGQSRRAILSACARKVPHRDHRGPPRATEKEKIALRAKRVRLVLGGSRWSSVNSVWNLDLACGAAA